MPAISVVFLHPCARHYRHRWPSTHAMQLHWRNLESFTWIKVYMSHLGFNVMQFSVAHHPHLVPHCWSVLSPTCAAVVPSKLSQGVWSPAVFCSESFNPPGRFLWTVQIYLDHSIFPQATHPSSRLHPCSRQAIHSFETLLRVDRRFVSPKKGAKCWTKFLKLKTIQGCRMAVLLEAFWRDGCLLGRLGPGQKFSLKAGWLVSPILQTFTLPSKQELFDHCFLLLELGLHSVGVVSDGEPLCLVNTMLFEPIGMQFPTLEQLRKSYSTRKTPTQ